MIRSTTKLRVHMGGSLSFSVDQEKPISSRCFLALIEVARTIAYLSSHIQELLQLCCQHLSSIMLDLFEVEFILAFSAEI